MIAQRAKSHLGRFVTKNRSRMWMHLAPFSLSHLQQQRPCDRSISLSSAYALAMFLNQRFSSCRMASCMAAMRSSASWDSSESLVSPPVPPLPPSPVGLSVCFDAAVEEGGLPSPFFSANLSAAFKASLSFFFWILRFYCLRFDLSRARFAAKATAWSRFWATGLRSSISSSLMSSSCLLPNFYVSELFWLLFLKEVLFVALFYSNLLKSYSSYATASTAVGLLLLSMAGPFAPLVLYGLKSVEGGGITLFWYLSCSAAKKSFFVGAFSYVRCERA